MSTSGNSAAAPTAYDIVPYPSASFPQSHPLRLAAMGRLMGIKAPAPSKARVLELGCADGANLLPMAELFPQASFLGIDASKVNVVNMAPNLQEQMLLNGDVDFSAVFTVTSYANLLGMKLDPLKDLPPVIGLAEGRYVFGSPVNQPWKSLGELVALSIIRELGYATDEQTRKVLNENRLSISLGSLLVELGLIKPGDMVVCLGAGSITTWANALPAQLAALRKSR